MREWAVIRWFVGVAPDKWSNVVLAVAAICIVALTLNQVVLQLYKNRQAWRHAAILLSTLATRAQRLVPKWVRSPKRQRPSPIGSAVTWGGHAVVVWHTAILCFLCGAALCLLAVMSDTKGWGLRLAAGAVAITCLWFASFYRQLAGRYIRRLVLHVRRNRDPIVSARIYLSLTALYAVFMGAGYLVGTSGI